MAGNLVFSLSAVHTLIAHAKAAPAQQATFNDLCDAQLLKPGVKLAHGSFARPEDIDPSKIPPSLLLAKDHGVYLMSAGVPRQLLPGTDRSVVAYAERLNPEKDDGWYERAMSICGGDDFTARLPVTMFEELLRLRPKATRIRVRVSARRIAIATD